MLHSQPLTVNIPHLRTLSDLPCDMPELPPGSRFEMSVHVDIFPLSVRDFAKSVDVELTDEGCVVFVVEVTWKDLLGEAGYVLDAEGVAVGSPRNRLYFRILSIQKAT